MQTKKIQHKIPIVLYGKEFWDEVINFDVLVYRGVITKKDLGLIRFCDSPQEAYDYLISALLDATVSPTEEAIPCRMTSNDE